MKFLNYNNKFLEKKVENFSKINKSEKKAFNLNEIIANNTNKDISQTANKNIIYPEYSEEVEESENIKQINISNIKTNNLSNLNLRNSISDYSNKKAFTEPSSEYPFGGFNANLTNIKSISNDVTNQRIFPVIENGENKQNEDSFDFNVNEE